MTVRFVKMHGAGNDFVMIDNREESFPMEERLIAAMAARGTGIGCEGVIFVQRSADADFRMRFFNPDGSEAELCGNGARCVAAFARRIGAAAFDQMCFETLAGVVSAEILAPNLVRIGMPEPKDLRDGFVNTGVPHAIVPADDLAAVDVEGVGRRIRHSAAFAPDGANVDFVSYVDTHHARIRTYERGVEAESFACGTGAVAAACIGVVQHGQSFPVTLTTGRGIELTVDGSFDGVAFTSVTLTGPVETRFEGAIEI